MISQQNPTFLQYLLVDSHCRQMICPLEEDIDVIFLLKCGLSQPDRIVPLPVSLEVPTSILLLVYQTQQLSTFCRGKTDRKKPRVTTPCISLYSPMSLELAIRLVATSLIVL